MSRPLQRDQNLLVYEPVCHGLEHAPFNLGLLAAAAEAFEGRVSFAGETTHLQVLRQSAPRSLEQLVTWRRVDITPRRLSGLRRRFQYEKRALDKIWRFAAEASATTLICTNITEAGLLALKWKMWSTNPKRTVGAVFHSVLDRLVSSRSGRLQLRAAIPRGLRYLLLGGRIRDAVVDLVPPLAERSFVLPHPLALGLDARPAELDIRRIVFGYFGRGIPDRGFPLFLQIARDHISNGVKSAFAVIGSYSEHSRAEVQSLREAGGGRFFAPAPNAGQMQMDDYQQLVRETSYAVLPYPAEAYRFTCSGAVFDALTAAKPIIALRTPLFEELFSLMGDIGYLCPNEDELRRTVRAIIEHPPGERYRIQSQNLLRAAEFFGTAPVARGLTAALGSA
jgi:glycosyltransferase involved in cell wall biosynthesis